MSPTLLFLLLYGPSVIVVQYWVMLPYNCTGCILGRAPHIKETLSDFR